MTGDECPGGKSVFQITFLFGPNCTGNPVLSDTPVPFGPRNCDHSSASVGLKPNEAEAATMMTRAIFIFRLRIVIRMSEHRLGKWRWIFFYFFRFVFGVLKFFFF